MWQMAETPDASSQAGVSVSWGDTLVPAFVTSFRSFFVPPCPTSRFFHLLPARLHPKKLLHVGLPSSVLGTRAKVAEMGTVEGEGPLDVSEGGAGGEGGSSGKMGEFGVSRAQSSS